MFGSDAQPSLKAERVRVHIRVPNRAASMLEKTGAKSDKTTKRSDPATLPKRSVRVVLCETVEDGATYLARIRLRVTFAQSSLKYIAAQYVGRAQAESPVLPYRRRLHRVAVQGDVRRRGIFAC
jgi:hypothetical protein